MKFIVYLLIALCLFVHPSLALALSTPTYNENILNRDGLTRAPEMKAEPQVASFTTWGFAVNFLKGLSFIPVVQKTLDGSTTFSTQGTLKVLNNKDEAKNRMLATLKLTPKSIQDKFMKLIPGDDEFKNSANHNNCFTDEDGGSEHKPTSGQVSQSKSPGAAALTESSMALHSTMSIGKLPLTMYDWFSKLGGQIVSLDSGLKCGRNDEGTDVGTFDNGDAHKMEYNNDDLQWTAENYFSPEKIQEVLDCINSSETDPVTGKPKNNDCGNLTKGFGAITEFSTLVPYALEIFKWYGRGPNNESEGYTYTSKPVAFINTLTHGKFSQDIDLYLLPVINGTKTVEEAKYAWEAARRWDRDLFDCSLTPKQLQDPKHPCPTPQPPVALAGLRNELDAVETREPAQCSEKVPLKGSIVSKNGLDAAIKNAATLEHVQECVLQGIAYIEGADQEMEQSSCIPNQCGAAGPFQISVGVDSCGNKTCDQCGPNWKGRKCNDETWALEAVGGTAASACDVTIAARAAARIFLGKANGLGQTYSISNSQTLNKNAIILGADAYYGVTSPIERLGGLSYGEFVYSKCDPSYTKHVDHQFQTPTTGRPI